MCAKAEEDIKKNVRLEARSMEIRLKIIQERKRDEMNLRQPKEVPNLKI